MAKNPWTKMARKLAPEEGALRFKEDPASVVFKIPEFLKASGLTQDEMLKELQSGRLRASRSPPDSAGRCMVFITGDEAVRWLAARITAKRQH